MSTAAESTATLAQRSAQATRELCVELGLTVSPTDLKYLALALMQAAMEEVERNGDFAERIRTLYQSLLPAKPKRAAGSPSQAWKVKLTPVGTVDDALLDPYGPPNPFALQQLYGNAQLALALERYTPAKLRDAVALVQHRFPGTKPAKMTKAAIIDYIVRTLTAP